METNATITESQNKIPDITKNTVLLSITLRRFECQRKVGNDKIEVEADKHLIKVQKNILESPELQEIKKIDGELRNWLRRYTLPSVLKNGVYMLPNGLLGLVDDYLTKFVDKRKELIQSFLQAYEVRKAETQLRLNGLFNPADYPSIEEIEACFNQEFNYLSFSIPDTLSEISSSIFNRERQKLADKIQEAGEMAQAAIRLRFAEMLNHMIERLTPSVDGKKKIFRDSCVNNLQEFIDNFKAMNITNDVELENQIQKAHNLIQGVDPDSVRSDENFREELKDGFKEINDVISTMVTTKVSRLIDLED